MDQRELFRKYGTSHYAGRDFLENPSFCRPRDREAARVEYIDDPAAVFLANIEQARADVRATAERWQESKADGLFDRDGYKAAPAKERRAWFACVDVVRGDYSRAVGELEHWRCYAQLHIEGKLQMPKRTFAVRELAQLAGPGADRTAEDDGVPF